MSTTETIVGQQIDAPVDLDPPPAWLPLVRGDGTFLQGEETQEHNWPASLFIFLMNLTALGLGAGAAGSALVALGTLMAGEWELGGLLALLTVGLVLGCVVQRGLSRHVKHFSRWGWYGAMVELGLMMLSNVSMMISEPSSIAGGAFAIGINLLWMAYFWERRADFDVDLGS